MVAYPAYQYSGVSWIGEIPENWNILPLYALAKHRSVINQENLELLSIYLDKGVVLFKDVAQKRTNPTSDDLSKYQRVDHGNLVLNNQQAWRGSVGVSFYTGIVSPAYIVLQLSHQIDKNFANYFFRDTYMVSQYLISSKGVGSIQRNLYWQYLKRTKVFLPPLEEQQQIARYLDWKNTKINKFIKAKKKLITLLKEQKQNIINQAVTKGINPDVKMKDSDVDWLGEVPQHWETRKIKYITKILRGKFSFRPRNDPSLYDGQFPFIQTGDVAKAGKYIDSYKQTLNEKGYQVSKEFPKGTLTMTIAANIGEVAILDFNACFPDSIVGFVPLKTTVDYLYYLFLSMKSELLREAPVNTQGNLNIERIGNIFGVVPPLSEQEEIVQYIEKEIILIDKTITKAEYEIELIQEYQTRLISDVVTGKIDVRAVEIPEFEQVEDESSINELVMEDIEP